MFSCVFLFVFVFCFLFCLFALLFVFVLLQDSHQIYDDDLLLCMFLKVDSITRKQTTFLFCLFLFCFSLCQFNRECIANDSNRTIVVIEICSPISPILKKKPQMLTPTTRKLHQLRHQIFTPFFCIMFYPLFAGETRWIQKKIIE